MFLYNQLTDSLQILLAGAWKYRFQTYEAVSKAEQQVQYKGKVCSINFESPAESPWMNAIPAQLWLFLVKIRSSWHDLMPKIAQRVKDNVKLEQFTISRWSTSKIGKQLWHVWNHVASININSSFALKEKKAYRSQWITLN